MTRSADTWEKQLQQRGMGGCEHICTACRIGRHGACSRSARTSEVLGSGTHAALVSCSWRATHLSSLLTSMPMTSLGQHRLLHMLVTRLVGRDGFIDLLVLRLTMRVRRGSGIRVAR